MARVWLVIAILLGSSIPQIAVAKEDAIVVRGAAARIEIQRILNADNVDTEYWSSRMVADAISKIERGRAPEDFWAAYTQHVRAWRELADAEQDAHRVANDPDALHYVMMAKVRAERRIKESFDEVERIARRYGARMPIPLAEARRTS